MDAEVPSIPKPPVAHAPHAEPMHLSLGKSIAIAESVSSAFSLGTVWMVGRNPHMIAPVKKFLGEHIIYPVMSSYLPKAASQTDKDAMMKKAEEKASLFLKGVIMIGAGFATHIPTQMFLEGKSDLKEFKKVILGKSIGLTAAMGSLALINYMKPGAIEHVENSIADKMFHCDDATSKEHCEADKELCKLMLIDIPSSVISGLVNYQIARRF